jgi:hypothetical protein
MISKPIGPLVRPLTKWHYVPPRNYVKKISSTNKEICTCFISLWVMKEAAWKSLKGPHQPKTITKIKIHSVKKNKSKFCFLFSFNTTTFNGLVIRGKGVVIQKGRLILGIAVI